jgi:SAM-dependent methyltransferase
MNIDILRHIVCPSCGKNLNLKIRSRRAKEVLEGTLTCRASKPHQFRIRQGLPELLPFFNPSEKTKIKTEKSFSAKWRRAQDYREKTSRFYQKWYLERYGFGTLRGLKTFLEDSAMILEAGTGMGRDSRMYAACSKARVFGIDISESVRFAHARLKGISNLSLLRADLTRLPFPPRTFDFIACDQVLHHTPQPDKSLQHLVSRLKTGGHIAFYVYRKKGPIREFCDDYLRKTTTRMNIQKCREFSIAMTELGKSLHKLHAKIRIPKDIPFLDIKAGSYNLQRFIYWNVLKCFWNDEFDFDTNVTINFDWYHPEDAFRYDAAEVRQWCALNKLRILRLNVVEAGISILAQKRA